MPASLVLPSVMVGKEACPCEGRGGPAPCPPYAGTLCRKILSQCRSRRLSASASGGTDRISRVKVRFKMPVEWSGGIFFSLWVAWLILVVYVLMMVGRERKLKREIAGLKAMLEDKPRH